jgi:hypothetical protein
MLMLVCAPIGQTPCILEAQFQVVPAGEMKDARWTDNTVVMK